MVELSDIIPAGAVSPNSAQALRVLLAEDTQISAEALKAMADRFGIEMDVVGNGLDAIHTIEAAHAEENPYTLLLIDVMMPILDGVETTKRLRAMGFGPDQLTIVAVTAATSFDETRSYRAAGIQAFLAKPVSLKEFKATLEAWGHKPKPRMTREQQGILRDLEMQFQARNTQTLQLIDAALSSDSIDVATINEIRNLLHQIAGTATTFGHPQLGKIAKHYENALLHAPTDQGAICALIEEAKSKLQKSVKP